MKTVIVTGGAGFIGGHVVHALVRDGYRVVNVDALTYAADRRLLAPLEKSGSYVFVHADIRDAAAMEDVFAGYDPDGVMHLAAESHVDRSIENPLIFVETNVVGTANLLRAARTQFDRLKGKRRADFRFLHISTDEVFGSLGETGLFSETTPYDPSSPYSASKAASDHMVRAWGHTFGLPVVITNCSNNYGSGQFPEKLIPLMILKAAAGETLPVYGAGDNIRDWLYVADHAEALMTVFELGAPGETYCVGGHNELRNIDVVRAICDGVDERMGRLDGASRQGLIRFVADRPGHDQRYAIDASKIGRDLGWQPSVTFQEGLSKTIDWYLDNQWWWQPLAEKTGALKRRGLAVETAA
jgi:dTDP-glucose 4,6-dehydratase